MEFDGPGDVASALLGREAPPMLRIDEITTEAQFQHLSSQWSDLVLKSDRASLFLTHDWFRCCLTGYSEGKAIRILMLRDKEELIGIAPLWLTQDVIRRLPVRRLSFITASDTPYVD